MSKIDKLLKDIENNPKNVRFETIRKLLERAGYTATNNGSSHWQFRQEGKDTITIPYNKPIKVIYVKEVIRAIKEEK